MAVCDICSTPGMGTIISAEQMKKAVFGGGFDPFSLGLINMGVMAAMGVNKSQAYMQWKSTIVAQDYSDWNICDRCMGHLQGYLKEAPKPAGIAHAQVSSNPISAVMAAVEAENKYGKGSGADGSGAEKVACKTCGASILRSTADKNDGLCAQCADKSKKTKKCFVATVAFGSENAPELNTLRWYRDNVLAKNMAGRLFVNIYYKLGPQAAYLVNGSILLKGNVRNLLLALVEKIRHKYNIK